MNHTPPSHVRGEPSVSNASLLSPDAATDAVYRTLALFVGRGRQISVEDLALATKIPARTISAWLAGDPLQRRRCKGHHLLILQHFFGVAFTDRLLAPIGQGGRDLEPAADAPAIVVATLVAGAAEFAARAADGRYCHVDRAELADEAAEMIQILTPFTQGDGT